MNNFIAFVVVIIMMVASSITETVTSEVTSRSMKPSNRIVYTMPAD